jgi:hypothetical protein
MISYNLLHRIIKIKLAPRRLYGKKTVREAERARFLSEGEESEALRINGE